MNRSTIALIVLAILASIALTVAPALADTWDAFADFSSTAMPSHNWSYGWTTDTVLGASGYTFTQFTFSEVTGGLVSWHESQGTPANSEVGVKYPYLGKGIYSYGRIAGNMMNSMPPTTGYTILRWTAPAGISGIHTIIFPVTQNGTGCTVNVLKNPGASQVMMFTGGSTTAYRGAATFSPGDVVDFMFGPRVNDRWTYQNFNLKVQDGDFTQTGRVIDAEGNGLPGATMTLVGANPAYTTTTDSAGYYRFVLWPASYNVTAAKSAYTTSASTPATVSGAAGTLPTITLQRTGSWDAKGDWSSTSMAQGNPNGQWSYGQTTGTALSGYTFTLLTQAGVGEWSNKVGYWGLVTTASGATIAAPAIGYNTYSSTLGSFTGYKLTPKPSTNNRAIVRWKAPTAGWYSFTATFGGTVGNAVVMTSGSTYTTLAGPGTVSGWMGAQNMAVGDCVDFTTTAANTLEATVKSGASGVSGYVEDANHVRLANASVRRVGGTESTVTGADGTYTLVIAAPGTYSVSASKISYDTVTTNNIVVGSSLVPTNFTLPLGAVVSGTITDAAPPYSAVAGANVWSADGVNVTTTNSAGFYSFPQITRGSLTLNYAKTGFAAQTIAFTVAGSTTTQNVSLKEGWDLATDFNAASNPVGVWAYGYEQTTSSTFTAMTDRESLTGGQRQFWMSNGQTNNRFMFVKSLLFNGLLCNGPSACDPSWGWFFAAGNPPSAYHEGRRVIAMPGVTWTGMTGNEKLITRFTAPLTGYYKVTAKFAAASPSTTASKVAVRVNGSYVFGDPSSSVKQLNGFVGTSANGYTDSSGTANILTYSADMDLSQGQTVDTIVYGGVDKGWAQVDLTIAKSTTIISGNVTASNQPGNPAVKEAVITATGAAGTYTAITDAGGNFVLSVKPGQYTVSGAKSGYSGNSVVATAVTDQVTVANFTMQHSGIWDVVADYSTTYNPNAQWTYGDLDAGGAYTFTPYTTSLASGYPNTGSGANQPINCWTISGGSHIGKNYSSSPFTWTAWNANPYYWYVEPGAIFASGLWTGDSSTAKHHLAAIRWTAPDTRAVTISGSFIKSSSNVDDAGAIVKNGTILLNQPLYGFAGRAAVGYADSTGTPVVPFSVTLAVAAGDSIDFVQNLNWQPAYGWSIGYGYNGFPESNIGLQATISTNNSLLATKIFSDGMSVSRTGLVVSKVFPDCVYIEAADRQSGIKVTGASANAGDTVSVTGTLGTTSDGERYIAASTLTTAGTGSVLPVMMTNKDLGGGPYNFDAASGSGQRGVEDGAGLNNIGLLVKTTGKVTVVGEGFFYIDDGTHAKDASIFNGIRVWCPVGTTMPASGAQVSVTGISGIYNIGGRYFRGVRIADSSDVMAQ